ncbi:unnamed protein product [Rodentolepis nana]|uniref:EB domain-containing protein n=1 Tax=Rodentolepis nana TaxID=102285 RepID=A0A0R3TPT5_RODNA|nr:unnamed protein product [Rodentolepis nana]
MKYFLIFLAFAAATAIAYQIPYYIFMDCYDPICRLKNMYGFHCKNGLCSYVCNAGGCRSDGLPSRSMLGASNLIFYGCENPMCVMDGFYGYGCYSGACQFICSDTGCYEGTRVNPESRKTRRNRKKKLGEKYVKLQEEIESREKSESEKSKDEIATSEPVIKTTTTVGPLSPNHNVAITTAGTKTFIDEAKTTVPTPKEDSPTRSPTSLAKVTEASEGKAADSRIAPESNPLEEKKPPKQTTKKENKKVENEPMEVAKKKESKKAKPKRM